MKRKRLLSFTLMVIALAMVTATLTTQAQSPTDPFRVQPYLQNLTQAGVTVTWFTDRNIPGVLVLSGGDLAAPQTFTTMPTLMPELAYSDLEMSERSGFPDMFANFNYKHSLRLSGLTAATTYTYAVTLEGVTLSAAFTTASVQTTGAPIRFIALSDSETDPVGRTARQLWGNDPEAPAAQAPGSTGRPTGLPRDAQGREFYLATEQAGYAANLAIIKERNPAFLVMPGDLVQGGGYQRAWDEFFFHNAGKFDNPLSFFPILPALGNWENFGARNGGYQPAAVLAARMKYKAYFDTPPNANPLHQDQYYRVDYGPITIITLDSSNGLPDGQLARRNGLPPSDFDTQENISAATYPGDDLADFNPGSDQWNWAEAQLADAAAQGQLIFVQFHHAPYSSGTHGFPMSSPHPLNSGQGGTPMRIYSPLFEKYGVVAVFSGHSELFERSLVNGIHYYDVGIAGDGIRGPLAPELAQANNPYSQWMAHYDEPELWDGNRLISGGKHYGHVEVNVTPNGDGTFAIMLTPVHAFPVIDDNFEIARWERRAYSDEVRLMVDRRPAPADCFANQRVVAYEPGARKSGLPIGRLRSNPEQALGPADGAFVALGFGGSLTLAFDNPIVNLNGSAPDLRIWEVSPFKQRPWARHPEAVDVYASWSGQPDTWVYLGRTSDYDQAYDLGPLARARYIRLVDVSDAGQFGAMDDGFDLDAITPTVCAQPVANP